MDRYESRRKKRRTARDRYERRRGSAPMALRENKVEKNFTPSPHIPVSLPRVNSELLQGLIQWGSVLLRDVWWYIRNNPIIVRSVAIVIVVVIALHFLSYLFSGRVMPNVWSAGVSLGGMSLEQAEDALRQTWNNLEIDLIIGGEKIANPRADILGLRLNAQATAKSARDFGLGAVPFGGEVAPVIEVDYLTAQSYLLDLADEVNMRPYNAGYEWQDDRLIGINGREGRMLDVPLTIEWMAQETELVVDSARLELLMILLPPDVSDPSPYLQEANRLVRQPLELRGYDPYANQHYTWPIDAETFASWLEAGPASLTLRQDAFLPFLDILNTTLNPQGENLLYLSIEDTIEALRGAIARGQTAIDMRVRYRQTEYQVDAGDTGHRISRKTGLPFYLIEEANPGIVWGTLSIGQRINIPSRDLTMPEAPIPNKRIIVDLSSQYLMAYENGELLFEWPISSGVTDAPTYPGIYQILSHEERAYGSSITLCNNAGVVCGQWEMYWFMGIYRVSPHLVNGFHGRVLLPNGNYLGDGQIGRPTTFGCVMSPDEQAQLLYDWAEVGTVVEIISHEYSPMSDLGRLTLNRLTISQSPEGHPIAGSSTLMG